jgi:hypothetical protein
MESTYQIQSDYADDIYSEYDSDYDSYGYNDDDESLGSFIDSGLNTVGRIVSGGVKTALGTAQQIGKGIGTILGVNPVPASTSGIQNSSNLTGTVQTNTGKSVPVNLPQTIATKEDVYILQGAIRKINTELKKVADTTTTNGVALSKLSGEVKQIDEKHVAATKKQNELLHRLGRGVDKLEKDLKSTKQQAQMQMMLSMFMQPEIGSVKFTKGDGSNVTQDNATDYPVTTDNSDDNSMLPLLLMGGIGGDGGGDFASNPLSLILLMKAFDKD